MMRKGSFVYNAKPKKCKIFGKKIIKPTIADPIAVNNTAAAAVSFVLPANSLYSGDIRFVRCSIDVLNASALKTMAIENITKHHSVVEMEKEKT